MKVRPGLADVGRDLEDYGETFAGLAWLPLVGPWIERGRGLSKILSKILQRRKEGIGGRRAKLEEALNDLNKPIVSPAHAGSSTRSTSSTENRPSWRNRLRSVVPLISSITMNGTPSCSS